MKIAILSCFYPFRGGIAQFNASLLTELGKTHAVKAFNFTRQYPDFLFPGKTQYVTKDDEAVPVESEALLDTANPFSWIKTVKAVKAWDPDILVMRYWMPYFAPCLGFVARHIGPRCKVIGILDNVIPHEKHFFDTPLTRYFLSGVDGCVTLCNEVGEDLERIKPGAVRTVQPHPIYSHFGEKMAREDAEDMLGLQHGMKNILFFGLIRDYKGLDILLEAFDRLDQDYQLIIAGEPYGSFEKYERMIDRSPGRSRIHVFPKYIKDSEVSRYFSAADVTVLPYRSATQSGISAIAYHFDTPMIVTEVGGLKEAIGNRGTGIVTPDHTPECIAGAVKKYFSTPGLKTEFVENIHLEKERLGWTRFADDLVRFAESISK